MASVHGGGLFANLSSTQFSKKVQFAHNIARESGGGIYAVQSMVIIHGKSSFWGNSAAMNGGGIMANDESMVNISGENSNFTNNSAQMSGGGIYICHGTCLMASEKNSFQNNSARDNGGGIAANASTVVVNGTSYFTNNSALRYGGGIVAYDGSTLIMNGNNSFINNSAVTIGGGIGAYRGTTVTVNGESNFINNLAALGGGIGTYNNTTIMINGDSSFVSNSAVITGGGIDVQRNTTITINGNNCFINNLATKLGGGINAQKSATITINGNTSFINNSAGGGGGVWASSRTIITINGNGSFTNNSAARDGGGINGQKSTIVMINGSSSFINNSANEHGGGINAYSSTTITFSGNSRFINNFAAKSGGGITARRSTAIIVNGNISFMNNSAATNGGGIFAAHKSATIIINGNSHFKGNSAGLWGGGIFVEEGTVNVTGTCIVMENAAVHGGGIWANAMSNIIFSGTSVFLNNSAQNNGGGIYIGHKSTIKISGSTNFTNNSALFGGGIHTRSCILIIIGTNYFMKNSAKSKGGGIYLEESIMELIGTSNNVTWSSSNRIRTIWAATTFINNSAVVYGGGIYAYNGSSLNISGTTSFINNTAGRSGGALSFLHAGNLVCNGNILFLQNTAKIEGGAISAVQSRVVFKSKSNFTHNRSLYGGGVFLYQSGLAFFRSTGFIKNKATYGGGIHAFIGHVTFHAESRFANNSAMDGGGLSLAGNSRFYFVLKAQCHIYFDLNDATQHGGAIYVEDTLLRYCISDEETSQWDECFWGVDACSPDAVLSDGWEYRSLCNRLNYFPEKSHPVFHFSGNKAEAGSVLYGGTLDFCYVLNTFYMGRYTFIKGQGGVMFEDLATIETGDDRITSVISSHPFHVCPCLNSLPFCNIPELNRKVYPGQTFPISLIALGQKNGSVPTEIKTSFDRDGVKLGNLEDTQSVNKSCTDLHYTVFSNRKYENLSLHANGPCMRLGKPLIVHVNLLSCPIGFMPSDTTGCVCEKRLQKYTNSCNITDQTITRDSNNFWVGIDNQLVLHPHCPFDYCTTDIIIFKLSNSDPQCNYDRSGLLCGGCKPGLSLALGSSRCMKCSNAYLSLLIAFFVAGIGLVILLLVFKLTVAVGTINGLVFYANIIAVNRAAFFPSGEMNILTVFIAWVNLDLGIETCFYDWMDAYTRTWLQFVFPAYIWTLVGAIILFSHYSTTVARLFGSNPVSVLATLFLLSYTKLLHTIIISLSFTFLEYPNNSKATVWLYDGNTSFLQGKHIPLFIAALLALIFLFIPFTLVLLLGQWIQAYSTKTLFSWISNYRVKSLLDSYQAPLRNEYRCWVGVLLVIRCCLFLVFAFNTLGNPSVNLLAISSSMLGLAILLRFIGRVYREWYLDILDASFVLNLGILAAGTYHVRETGGDQEALTYTLVGTAFITFCGIVIYHAQLQIRDSKIWRNTIKPKLHKLQQMFVHAPATDNGEDEEQREAIVTPVVAPTTTFIELREPLLTD